MVEGKILKARGKTLEASFFAKESERLLQKMRAEATEGSRRQALATACGFDDAAVLDDLVELELDAETVAALAMVPLVRVAWADGKIQDSERAAIIRVAEEKGIVHGAAAHDLLEAWLAKQPGAELVEAWEAYVAALLEAMHDEAAGTLRSKILANSRAVAESARSFLGLGAKVSAAEAEVLDDLEKALS